MRFPYFSPPDWSTTRQNGSRNVIPPETPYVCRISRFFWETPFWHFLEPHGTRLGGLRGACLGTFWGPFPQISRFPGPYRILPEKCQNGPRKVPKRAPKSAKTGPEKCENGPQKCENGPQKCENGPDFEKTARFLGNQGNGRSKTRKNALAISQAPTGTR